MWEGGSLLSQGEGRATFHPPSPPFLHHHNHTHTYTQHSSSKKHKHKHKKENKKDQKKKDKKREKHNRKSSSSHPSSLPASSSSPSSTLRALLLHHPTMVKEVFLVLGALEDGKKKRWKGGKEGGEEWKGKRRGQNYGIVYGPTRKEEGREGGREGGRDSSNPFPLHPPFDDEIYSSLSLNDTHSSYDTMTHTGQGVALDGLPAVEMRRRMAALLEVSWRKEGGREGGREGRREGRKDKIAHFSFYIFICIYITVTGLAVGAAGSFCFHHLLPLRVTGMPSLPPSLHPSIF